MSLADIKQSAFEYDLEISTKVQGWDVFVRKVRGGYLVSVMLITEEDSDQTVVVTKNVMADDLREVRFEIMDAIGFANVTPAEVTEMAANVPDFASMDLEILKVYHRKCNNDSI